MPFFVKLTLRLPVALHSRLVKEADKNERSLNKEIVARLKASFEGWRQ
jgi:predicted HicB family RNase H-like nuclease